VRVFLFLEKTHAAIQSPKDLESLPDSHSAYPLVEDLINRLIIYFPEDHPY